MAIDWKPLPTGLWTPPAVFAEMGNLFLQAFTDDGVPTWEISKKTGERGEWRVIATGTFVAGATQSLLRRGTDGSNPSPSSEESANHQFLSVMYRRPRSSSVGVGVDYGLCSASKSAAALAASKESAVPLAMTFHSPRSPVFLLTSQVGTPWSVNA